MKCDESSLSIFIIAPLDFIEQPFYDKRRAHTGGLVICFHAIGIPYIYVLYTVSTHVATPCELKCLKQRVGRGLSIHNLMNRTRQMWSSSGSVMARNKFCLDSVHPSSHSGNVQCLD